jgi:hypothetical protein
MTKQCSSWQGKCYLPFSVDGRWLIESLHQRQCHFDGMVKVKTMEGKSEKEWKKENETGWGQKKYVANTRSLKSVGNSFFSQLPSQVPNFSKNVL